MARSDEFSVGASPVPEIAAGAARFRQIMGMHEPEQDYSRSVIPQSQSRAIGHAYMNMPEFDERAVPAYHAMREEVGRQFDHLTRPVSRGGMGINVSASKEDPYGGAVGNDYSNWSASRVIPELRHDVVNNGQLRVLSTASTGGHPVFTNDENDMFRAVHDAFGHLGSGRGIDMHGEDAAYQAHAAMFSPAARGALATETRGQNGALHLTGDFQDQKVGILPARFQVGRNLSPGQFGEMATARHDARLENRKQGL
jgi:hypothetical protein